MSWLSGWSKRIKLTIDKDDIDAILSDFPILVYLSASSGRNSDDVSAVFDELIADGNRKKIAVTTSDGETECYVEIEKWDDGNEKAWLWVKVPSIASGADTILYLYYDKDHADNDDYVGDTNSTPAENVWDANFVAVYHMADGADNENIYDSTGNDNDGVKQGAANPTELAGDIGKAQDFDGATSYIKIPYNASMAILDEITVESFARPTAWGNVSNEEKFMSRAQTIWEFGLEDNNKIQFRTVTGSVVEAAGSFELNSYQYAVATYHAATTTTKLFYNGLKTKEDAVTITGDIPNNTDYYCFIGQRGSGSVPSGTDFYWNGQHDENRISNIARAAEWIKATNESLTDDLLAFGEEELLPISARKYIIEIHDPGDSDALVTILGNAFLIPYTEGINQAPTLSFNLPANDSKVSNIIKANEIWLRDYKDGSLINRFRLTKKSDARGTTLVTTISGEGLINQLADEQLIEAYTPDTKTPTEIVTALLDLQALPSVITVGTIAPTSTRTMSFKAGETILMCLLRLRETIGGYISVDNDRALQWTTSIGEDKGQQIRYRKNLTGVTREIDYTSIGNLLYVYGAGTGDAKVKLSDVQAEDYVEDTDSQSAWGGIFVKIVVNKSITDADTLLAWATLILADLKDPRTTYRIDTIDIAESELAGFDFDALQLGSTVTVIDEELGIDVSSQITKITHMDLLHPEFLQIEFANLTMNINDTIETLIEAMRDDELEGLDPTLTSAIVFIIDGGGLAITTGSKGHLWINFRCEIIGWRIIADQEGEIVVDVKGSHAGTFPSFSSIAGSEKPHLDVIAPQINTDWDLTTWTTKVWALMNILEFVVDSVDTVTRVTITLMIKRV